MKCMSCTACWVHCFKRTYDRGKVIGEAIGEAKIIMNMHRRGFAPEQIAAVIADEDHFFRMICSTTSATSSQQSQHFSRRL